MKEKGRYFWKQRYYSICSIHREYNSDCQICKIGSWEFVFLIKFKNWVHKKIPLLYEWWLKL